MLRRYPKTLRWRQALPPLFVLGVIGLAVLALFLPLARMALAAGLALYGLILLVGSLPVALRKKDLRLMLGVALAIATMHFSWGSGFLWSALRSVIKKS